MNKTREELFAEIDKYCKDCDPEVSQLSKNWSIGIGLQDVDGLKVSNVLLELALENIKGNLTMNEVEQKLHARYKKGATTNE